MRTEQLRPGQQQALDTILQRLAERKSRIAVVLPTRYGKSDVIRLVAVQSRDDGITSGSIALSPSELLRDQLVRGDKLDQMVARYGLEWSARTMRTMVSISEHRPFSNKEYLLSATIQLATRNIDLFCDLVRARNREVGAPVVIHIDECHETSENKRRGELVARLDEAGALIVLYTATAIRADGEMIPGFRANVLKSDDVRRYVTTDAGDGENNRVDVYEGVRQVVELVADHTTTFKEAWEETPSPLCNLSREVIDVELNDIEEGGGALLLSECAPSTAKRYLTKAVQNPVVVERAVGLFLRELELRQRVNPDAAGIIFTCSDTNSITNKHAKEVAAAIAAARPQFQ